MKESAFYTRPDSALAASVVLTLFSFVMTPGLFAQTCSGPGTERWPVKVSLASAANPDKPKTVALNDLLALGDPPGVTHNDHRYQDARIPAFSNTLNVEEGGILQTTGWLYLVATEKDCDYHIQISNKPRTTADPPTPDDDCLIVEAPKPDFVDNADLKQRLSSLREYIKAKILRNAEPSNRGSVMVHPVCVQATGQLFYDDAHLGANGQKELRGKRNMQSHTLWELHPLTDFKIVQSSACQF